MIRATWMRAAMLSALLAAAQGLDPVSTGGSAGSLAAQATGNQPPLPGASVIPRFPRPASPIALTGTVRPSRYMEASGRKAAFLGREDGSFEAWVYPLKVLHDFTLAFAVSAYADPIPGPALATTVDIRPEASTVRFSHAIFTADATWLVPLNEEAGLVLLDISTSEPITLVVKFRPDLKPMWPAGLGGQYSYWDDELKAYVIGEGSGKNAALVGSPLGLTPPEQPAHNLPDAPSQFSIAVTPDTARRGLVPIVVAASVQGLAAARKTYAAVLASAPALYQEAVAHARALHDGFMGLDTPDDRLDLAYEWGKVALDKGFVCNPHLGCGLIAGLGPSGTTERPGFGWYFGGDAFINAWAIEGYGDFDTVKTSLEFLRTRQRADGKMMHELSQSAGFIRWFEDYPYGYYHADTTPLYIVAVRDYVQAAGDAAAAKDFWPSVRKAYDYCASTDEDGDGLMDNTKAGLAAAETGTLRRRDVLTDVFLASVWTEAAGAAADLARVADPSFAATAEAASKKARASLNARFLDDANRRINYAIMKDGKGQAEQTVWPAVGLWRGMFEPGRPAVEGMLDELARAGIGSDWGARMLSRESRLYEPLGYNNGAVWPFLTGFGALALYTHGRAPAAWAYLDATADLTFLEPRGYMPELFSGDRLRTVDAAVPHQLFATTGFMSTLIRGLIGMGPGDGSTLRIAPRLPEAWGARSFVTLRNVRWRDSRFDVTVRMDQQAWQRPGVLAEYRVEPRAARRGDRVLWVDVRPTAGSAELAFDVALPPGAEPAVRTARSSGKGRPAVQVVADPRGPRRRVAGRFEPGETGLQTVALDYSPGIEMALVQDPLRLGDIPERLRVIDARLDGRIYTVRLQGRRGRTYPVELVVPFQVVSLEGAKDVKAEGLRHRLEVTVPAGAGEWADAMVRLQLGARLAR